MSSVSQEKSASWKVVDQYISLGYHELNNAQKDAWDKVNGASDPIPMKDIYAFSKLIDKCIARIEKDDPYNPDTDNQDYNPEVVGGMWLAFVSEQLHLHAPSSPPKPPPKSPGHDDEKLGPRPGGQNPPDDTGGKGGKVGGSTTAPEPSTGTPAPPAAPESPLGKKQGDPNSMVDVMKMFGRGGYEFEPFLPEDKTDMKMYVNQFSRENVPPDTIAPFECRIGLSRFIVPPINMSVKRVGKITNLGGGLRTSSTPKFNSGYSETMISLTIYFPTHESIWGFPGEKLDINFDNENEQVIDKYLSSLRGLIAQFKYAPFLPIKNKHLNGALGINSVALQSMQVSTIDGFPFALAVQLDLLKFNSKVYIPMVESLDDAIHWGRFRQYMGRAADRLAEIAGRGFLTGISDEQNIKNAHTQDQVIVLARASIKKYITSNTGMAHFDKSKEWNDGSKFDLWYPAHTPAHVAYPDIAGFRDTNSEEEKKSKNWWQQLLGDVGIDYSTEPEAGYEKMKTFWSGVYGAKFLRDEMRLLQAYLKKNTIVYNTMGTDKLQTYSVKRVSEYLKENPQATDDTLAEIANQVKSTWFGFMYQSFISDPYIDKILNFQQVDKGFLLIKEWEVPMLRLNIDSDTALIQSVSVSLGNNLVKMQLQMMEEPAYQHVGTLDTTAQISLIVFGEDNLTRLIRVLEHINGLARLEHGHGVLGFLGIKNVVTALCGMKYCMVQDMTHESIPNQPNVYKLTLTLIDFDVFQQKREILSNDQQADLIEAFSKRNPFLRIKQHWGAFNAYPDFPLDVRDPAGKIIGHLDPDFYFKAFKTIDKDHTDFREYNSKVHHTFMNSENDEAAAGGLVIGGDGIQFVDGQNVVGDKMDWWEPNADQVRPDPYLKGFTGMGTYQRPYVDDNPNPTGQFEAMLQNTHSRDISGRMVRAFPTYMLWLIDEGGRHAGVKLFDNFYGLQSVLDIAGFLSEDSMDDTIIMQISNLYSRLSTPYRDLIDETMYSTAKIINTRLNRERNTKSGFTDLMVTLDTIDLKPGVRVHLRMGYSANPNNLDTIFNGTITEVQQGEVITVVCQSDAIELSQIINDSDPGAHSGRIDGSLFGGFWLSEPRDLMTRMLSMGSSVVKDTAAHASRGKVFSENRFGIKHFGMILTDEMTDTEKYLTDSRHNFIGKITAVLMGGSAGGGTTDDPMASAPIKDKVSGGANSLVFGAIDVVSSAVVNLGKSRDYELFKRNIYPGNGSGISQYQGGDLGDGGLAMGFADAGVSPDGSEVDPRFPAAVPKTPEEIIKAADLGNKPRPQSPIQGLAHVISSVVHPISAALGLVREGDKDDDVKGADEVSFRASTFMKSVWDIFQTCAALLPNYIVAVRPFEGRSTIFYGKPHWSWTSSVVPISKGLAKVELSSPDSDVGDILSTLRSTMKASQESDEQFYERLQAGTLTPSADPAASSAGIAWDGKDIATLPLVAQGISANTTALIPVRGGKFGIEMHLPVTSSGSQPAADTSDESLLNTDINSHIQMDELPPEQRHPWYMDRGRQGKKEGGTGSDSGDNDYKKNGAIKSGDDPKWPGTKGAFGYLDPNSEQYYVAMRWPYKGSRAEGQYLQDFDIPSGSRVLITAYRKDGTGKKLMVYNQRSREGCICTPGDWGPKGTDTGKPDDFCGGLSPDAYLTLKGQTGDQYLVGFVPDGTKLGRVKFSDTGSTSSGLPPGGTDAGEGHAPAPPPPTTDPSGRPVETQTTDPKNLPDWMKSDEAKKRRGSNDDIATYAYTWGWKDKDVPADYTNPDDGLTDEYGQAAKEVFNSERSITEGNDIWKEFRGNFAHDKQTKDIFYHYYPNVKPEDPLKYLPLSPPKKVQDLNTKEIKVYLSVVDEFMKFMWQNKFNRGWLVQTVDAQVTPGTAFTPVPGVPLSLGDVSDISGWLADHSPIAAPLFEITEKISDTASNAIDTVAGWLTGDNNDKDWNFDAAHEVWNQWLQDQDKATEWMKDHKNPGKDHRGLLLRSFEEFKTKIWDSVMGVLSKVASAVGSVLTGVLNMLRMSLMLLNNGLEMASFSQQQANLLNRVYNDSTYFQAGPPGTLAYLVDNPFTREFHEPVVEVREPFQRVHLLSSFKNIISNQITEQTGATTVVTATSNGKHPVTVYFDKGAPSDRQVEQTVETGLLWDKPEGLPIVRNILHPIETLRGISKKFGNGDDETSSQRVALWFLKESLKDIYTGEITIIGDSSIRAHDLIYIGDVYSRIYGLAEVEQVVHHFNSELGFVTSITPNAIVTINDPAKWSLTSFLRHRLDTWNLRNDLKHTYGNLQSRGGYSMPQTMAMQDLARSVESQLKGGVEYTGGNSAIIKDMQSARNVSALVPGGFPDFSQGTAIGALRDGFGDFRDSITPPGINRRVSGAGALKALIPGVAPIEWGMWNYVKNNLLDQQGCYIQYLTQDGQPMDAGLSYNRGVAVGTQRTSTLFKNSLRLKIPFNDKDGNSMIATNDLLANSGWEPQAVDGIVEDIDLFLNETNAQIYKLAGRPSPASPPNGDISVYWVHLTAISSTKADPADPNSLTLYRSPIIDGDTIEIEPNPIAGAISMRLNGINAPEIPKFYKNQPARAVEFAPDLPGIQSFLWLEKRLVADLGGKGFAIRVSNVEPKDIYGRALGYIFADVGDDSMPDNERETLLKKWAGDTMISWDAYQPNGIPYTINWESIALGHSNVYLFGLDKDKPDEGVIGGTLEQSSDISGS